MPDVTPVAKPTPIADNQRRGRTIGSIHDDAIAIYIHDRVLESILDYSEQDLTHERGGFLLGGLHIDQRPYVEVRYFVPAVDTQQKAASLRFTHETWSALTRDIEQRFPEQLVIGWQHTHPNLGVFLSGYDLFIHRNFFRQSWQIALVVDPVRHDFRFFQWRGGEVVDCGFICVQSDLHD